ncbi:adenylate isopentenyltransferase 5, chloroplastic-like [Typha latifolia]|uniref:adenylate isopentenyltransferase 5, chloroplastic-like n=1 Tax=Typha latifolia TaxID=4733 RepID=UPI003C2C8BBC
MECSSNLLRRKGKVVFILGATGAGKSKLSINLATRFNGEVINSDKMQIYNGLDVITNKVTEAECADVPHHLLGGVHPDADFTATDFRREAMLAVESILSRGCLPIIAGGSNSYVEVLVDGEDGEFRHLYDCCFVWVDVDLQVLHDFVSARVDKMVQQGLVEEARGVFDPDGDYSKGVRRSIGVPEMDRYFRAEGKVEEEELSRLFVEAIEEIKVNTCKLTCCQLQKIHRFCSMDRWEVHRVDATRFFLNKRDGLEEEEEVWEKVVGIPSTMIVGEFLNRKSNNFISGIIEKNELEEEVEEKKVNDHLEEQKDGKGEADCNDIANVALAAAATATATATATPTATATATVNFSSSNGRATVTAVGATV